MSIEHLHAVPHLTTALSGPLHDIETHLLKHQAEIETWFRQQWLRTPAPFYASVDLRNAGFKLAPVDTNLFPAGFNNLNPAFMTLSIQAVQSVLERICPKAVRILLIPENHTRNQFYLESLASLQEIITKAGFEIRIGSIMPELEEKQTLTLSSGRELLLEPIQRQGDKIVIDDYEPCLVLLNNDLSSGRPEILENLDQMILPPLELGWSDRLKSDHFTEYHRATKEFAELIDIDPWLITPLFCNCGKLDFMKREGEDCLASNVDRMLIDIQKEYDKYQIDKPPFVIVKADSGTYGMGIMTIHNGDEVQEGIYTFETWGDSQSVAEPVVYMVDHFVVGGFYRVHTERGANENLNAPGMHFEPLAFAESCNAPDNSKSPDADPNRFYAYGVIARLALLAAAREHTEHLNN